MVLRTGVYDNADHVFCVIAPRLLAEAVLVIISSASSRLKALM